MGQMKEFSHMANTNYHKHLRKERSQQHIDQVSQYLEWLCSLFIYNF